MKRPVRGRQSRTQKTEAPGTPVDEPVVLVGERDPRWREKLLERLRQPSCGGLYDAAHAAGVDLAIVHDAEARDPDFHRQVNNAIGLATDRLVSAMHEVGERGNNPIPHLARLKAARPREYVEKHLIVTVGDASAFGADQARELLRGMLADIDPVLRGQLAAAPVETGS